MVRPLVVTPKSSEPNHARSIRATFASKAIFIEWQTLANSSLENANCPLGFILETLQDGIGRAQVFSAGRVFSTCVSGGCQNICRAAWNMQS
jgi:hypothetical protein